MLRCTVVKLVPAQHCTVSIPDQDCLFSFVQDLRFKIQVGSKIERPAQANIETEVVGQVFIRTDMPLLCPLLLSVAPKMLK